MNISIPWATADPNVIGVTGTYQRVDNSAVANNPVITVSGLTTSPADLTPSGVPNGQYAWTLTPVYANGRVCSPQATGTTAACAPMNGVYAFQIGSNIVVEYTAPPSVSTVQVTITTPNGGSFVQSYTNGNTIVYTPPVGQYGDFTVTVQSVCDATTGFFGPAANGGTVTIAAPVNNPTLQGTVTVVCNGDCGAQIAGGLQFNLAAPLSADLTVQMALQYTTPTGTQQYGCSLLPAGDVTGSCQASGYATFIIPGGVLQATIPAASIQFSTGISYANLLCFCNSNPDYATIFMNTMFLHAANQPSIQISVTAIDTRITVTQI